MIVNGTNLFMTRGDSENITVSLEDYSFSEGDIVEFSVRKTATSQAVQLYKKISSFTDGKAYIDIEPADTKNIPFGDYLYDIQWTSSGGAVHTIIKPSMFTLLPEITYGTD